MISRLGALVKKLAHDVVKNKLPLDTDEGYHVELKATGDCNGFLQYWFCGGETRPLLCPNEQ